MMRRKINNRLIMTAALAIVATLLLTVAVCYHSFQDQVLKDLKGYAMLINDWRCSFAAADSGETGAFEKELTEADYGQLFATFLTDQSELRVTVIKPDGVVIYDSEADIKSMENHSSRPEFIDTMSNGEGSMIRKSETLDENTYYYAMQMSNRQILRVAKDAASIYSIMEETVPWLLLLSNTIFVICLILAYVLADGLMKPIKLIAQDVNNINHTEAYEELQPYITAIQNQHDDVVQNALMRQEFTANVSHELKTPLAAISGYAELIQNGMAASEAEVQRFAGEIHNNANRLLTLINDIIRLSELDSEDTGEVLEPINLADIAGTCVNMLQINAEKHMVTLSFEGEDVIVRATKQMLEEVLYNLCDNAIRYNREGGSVQVTVRNRLNTAVLTVKDTGIGIPKEHQERVFERFYRVDKGRSKSTGGTGLGLAIVKHILMKLQADLSMNSVEGEGTEIVISFPAQ